LPRDAIDNHAFLAQGKLTMPVLAIGGDKSYEESLATEIKFVATDVTPLLIPDPGHWLMEEQPAETVAAIEQYIEKKQVVFHAAMESLSATAVDTSAQ
jgi:pimeloyl-ACP methyl ester carboxylesterase